MDLSRRKLFGLLAASSLATLGAGILPPPKMKDAPDRFMYRGYEVRWTGWKESPCNSNLCAQWLAWQGSPKGKFFVSASGGRSNRYNRGDEFDITVVKPEDFSDLLSTPEQLDANRKRTLDRLIQLLHEEGF